MSEGVARSLRPIPESFEARSCVFAASAECPVCHREGETCPMNLTRTQILLAAAGCAISASSALAQPYLINGSGATLQENFFLAPASTNDFIDVNGDMVMTPDFGAQLAPVDTTPPFMASQHWQMTYRVVGSGNGFNELVSWGATYATTPDGDPANLTLQASFSDRSILNRSSFVVAGIPQALANSANAGGTPFRSTIDGSYFVTTSTNPVDSGVSIDFAALDVPVSWAVRQGEGVPAELGSQLDRLPGQLGYGHNPRVSLNKDGSVATDILGTPQDNKLSSLRSEPLSLIAGEDVFLNTNTGSPDDLTIFDTPISITPVAAVVNFGVGMEEIKMSDLRHLSATGRRMNGENLMKVNRDVGSGTRNAFMNGICLDPSWGAGENIGPRTVSSSNDLVGPNFQPSNKGGSSRVEGTVRNHRLAIGHSGAERGINSSWLTNGSLELLAVQSDIKGGTVFARPTTDAILNNDENGYTINGPAVLATIGDPLSAPASLGGWGWDPSEVGPNPNPIQPMRNPQAAAYLNNITRSVRSVKSNPGADETVFSPGEWLATQFVLVAAAEFNPDPPCSIQANSLLNPFLKNFSLNDPNNIFNRPEFATFNQNSAGFVPARTSGQTYSDGVVNGMNYVDQNGANVAYGSNLPMRNKIAGDFDNDGARTAADVEEMLQAWNDRHGDGTPFQPGTNAVIEILGDFDGDGSFTDHDVRYWADGLAIDGMGNANRQIGFTMVDQAFAMLAVSGGDNNFFGTVLATDLEGSVSNYESGDSRGDITNENFNNLPNFVPSNEFGVGADGIVDCYDITYVFMNFGNFSDTFDAVQVVEVEDAMNPGQMIAVSRTIDLAADMNGDLIIDQSDVDMIVTDILNTEIGDVNLDGMRNEADMMIAQMNLGNAGTWCTGDVNGDGIVDQDDLDIIAGVAACPADLTKDGIVNGADLANLLANWGENPGVAADLNGDGFVNGADLASLLATFGDCP